MRKFDAVIAGNGPAGSIAALVLARAGRSVLLIGRSGSQRKIGEALIGAARPLMRHLGLQHVLENDAHQSCHGNAAAWGSDRLVFTDMIRDPHGLGFHLDRERFDRDLENAAIAAGAEKLTAIVQEAARAGDEWRIKAGDQEFSATVLGEATGRGSAIARKIGIEVLKDDSLMAVYSWLPSADSDRDSRTMIEASDTGWWYTARLPGHTRVIAFHSDFENTREWLDRPEIWREKLLSTKHLAKYASEDSVKLHCRPAHSARLAEFCGDGWLAMGDAAIAFDPLSSQGIYNSIFTGFRGGSALVDLLHGSTALLNDYEKRLEEIHQAYRLNQQRYYSQEKRWGDHPFWQRRALAPLTTG